MTEYYRIADIVAAFDQRLLTVKSWGVTFALATLALGFQQDHFGLFLVAAAGGSRSGSLKPRSSCTK